MTSLITIPLIGMGRRFVCLLVLYSRKLCTRSKLRRKFASGMPRVDCTCISDHSTVSIVALYIHPK